MCGIAGFFDAKADFGGEREKWEAVLKEMNRSQKHRGPDEEGIYLGRNCGLAHVRLSIIDLSGGQQPMVKRAGGNEWAIVYNGEIYNMKQLRKELQEERYGSDSGRLYGTRSGFREEVERHLCLRALGRKAAGAVFVPGPAGGEALLLCEKGQRNYFFLRDKRDSVLSRHGSAGG